MPCRNVVHRLLALLYQWGRCFGSLKGFQSRLTVSAITDVILWSNVHMNFICTGQDSTYLGLENGSIFSRTDTESSYQRLPIDSCLGAHPRVLDPSVYQTGPLTAGGSPGPLVPSSLVNIGFKVTHWPHNIDLHINLLNPTGHVTHQQFNIQQLYAVPTLSLCVLYLSENKQRLVPLTP